MAVVTTMTPIGQFLTLWLLLWLVLFMVAYAVTALVVEPLERWWQERAALQERAKDIEIAVEREIARIDAQAAEAVERMGQAYLQAQALIRQDASRREQP